jgi:hypothetical protein
MRSLLAATAPPHNSCKTSFCSKPHSEVITGATDSAQSSSAQSSIPALFAAYRGGCETFASGNRRIRSVG